MRGETLFRLRVVVDDVEARDVPTADNVLVVIRYRAPFAVDEILPVSQITRLLPNHIHIAGSITHRSIFLIEYRILGSHHVEQDTETRRIVGDVRILGPELSAQTPSIRLVVLDKVRTAIVFSIEEKNIHPNIRSLLPQLAGDFQQDTDTACSIVGPIDRRTLVLRIRLGIRIRTRIPMGKEHQTLLLLGIERADDVLNLQRSIVVSLDDCLLDKDLSTMTLQFRSQKTGTCLVRLRVRDTRAKGYLLSDILVCAIGIEGCIGRNYRRRLDLRLRRSLAPPRIPARKEGGGR